MPNKFTVTLDPKFDQFQTNVEETNAIAERVAGRVMPAWATKVNDKRLYGRNNYAPRIPGSKYVRTGRLGADWQASKVQNGLQFQNNTPYASRVVGDGARDGQAAIHQGAGRWWLGRDRIEDEVPELVDDIGEKIEEALIP